MLLLLLLLVVVVVVDTEEEEEGLAVVAQLDDAYEASLNVGTLVK